MAIHMSTLNPGENDQEEQVPNCVICDHMGTCRYFHGLFEVVKPNPSAPWHSGTDIGEMVGHIAGYCDFYEPHGAKQEAQATLSTTEPEEEQDCDCPHCRAYGKPVKVKKKEVKAA